MAASECMPLLASVEKSSHLSTGLTVVMETTTFIRRGEAVAVDVTVGGGGAEPGDNVHCPEELSAGVSTADGHPESPETPVVNRTSGMGILRTIMTVIKGNMGTGILAMPYAVQCAGLLVGPLCIFLMGCIALCCMHFLVRSCRIQRARAEAAGAVGVDMNYPTLMEWSLKTAHPSLAGRPALCGRRCVNALQLITQLGFCSVYIVFVATNIQQAVKAQTGTEFALWKYQLIVAVPLMIYSQMRGLNKVAPCSIIANFLNVLGLVMIFVNFFSGQLPDVGTRPAFAGWSMMPAFFGTVVFSFEGISLVLPVEGRVRDKQIYSAPFGVLTLSLTFVNCLYTAMGFFGFLVYGLDTLASITLNLPTTPWYYFAVKPTFSAVMFLSYHLQLFVPVQIVMTWLIARNDWDRPDNRSTRHKAEALIRLLFFTLTLIISVLVPKLDLLISLVGAVASSFLALILPALIYLLTMMTQPQRPHVAVIVFLVFIIVLGFLGFVIGTYTSIRDIVQSL